MLILGHGARLAACGVAIGLVLAFGLTRLMASMLFGVSPRDFYTFAAISALLSCGTSVGRELSAATRGGR